MQQKEAPTPELFWKTLTAFQHSAALKAALDTDIFTAIANGARTASEIAGATSASERGVRVICDTMTVLGFLTKDDSSYALTESSALFLNRDSPAYLGSTADFILSPAHRR